MDAISALYQCDMGLGENINRLYRAFLDACLLEVANGEVLIWDDDED